MATITLTAKHDMLYLPREVATATYSDENARIGDEGESTLLLTVNAYGEPSVAGWPLTNPDTLKRAIWDAYEVGALATHPSDCRFILPNGMVFDPYEPSTTAYYR